MTTQHTQLGGWELFLLTLTRWLIYIYVILRIVLFFIYPLEMTWYFRFMAFIFFLAELFILTHALGYFSYLKIVLQATPQQRHLESVPLHEFPPVAIVVASYKEPLSILEDTLVCLHNLTYPNKHLYFLDDTRYDKPWDTLEKVAVYKEDVEKLCQSMGINLFRRKWHHAKAGMVNDFLEFLSGNKKPEFVLTQFDFRRSPQDVKYLIIFDADMNPLPGFVEPIVALLEKYPKVGFVQTPQYYTNFSYNRVARAASLMQAIFYEYICEGKGLKGMMFFCGTNAVLRLEALRDVGGIDLTSVTEDIATAFKMHKKGWDSLYVNKVTAFGMAPEDLGSFFKQQHRWASGTVGLLPNLFKSFLKTPFQYPVKFWWEYFLSSSYYLIGWAYLTLLLGPVVYLLWDVPIYMFPPAIYILVLLPYNVLANYLFYSTLCNRGYKFTTLFSGVILGLLSMPVFMQASIMGLFGKRSQFVVTPKGDTNSLSMRELWAQTLTGLVCFSTIVWGMLRLIYEGEPIYGITINLVWITYYFTVFSSIFYYNQPVEAKAFAEYTLGEPV